MKKYLLLRMLAMVTCMMCLMSASAQEAYMEYTAADSTLTYYYDNYRSSRAGITYDLPKNTNYFNPGWDTDGYSQLITHVVFDPTFADYRPVSAKRWFYHLKNLQTITGMKEYFNTSEVITMEEMFKDSK